MNVEVAAPLLVGLLLASLRAVAWLFIVPPFATRAIPATVKVIIAVALSLPVAPQLAGSVPELTAAGLIGAAVIQVFVGVALGFVTYLLFAAVQAAGDLVDLFGGFSISQAYDPMSQSQNSVFGRFTGQIAVVLLFVLNGHLLVIRGFMASYDAVPLDASLDVAKLGHVLTAGLTEFLVAAVQIAAPLIGVLFVVDVGLGLLTRIAPALNAFQLGFPAKILATLLLFGACIPLLPGAVDRVVDLGLRAVAEVIS